MRVPRILQCQVQEWCYEIYNTYLFDSGEEHREVLVKYSWVINKCMPWRRRGRGMFCGAYEC